MKASLIISFFLINILVTNPLHAFDIFPNIDKIPSIKIKTVETYETHEDETNFEVKKEYSKITKKIINPKKPKTNNSKISIIIEKDGKLLFSSSHIYPLIYHNKADKIYLETKSIFKDKDGNVVFLIESKNNLSLKNEKITIVMKEFTLDEKEVNAIELEETIIKQRAVKIKSMRSKAKNLNKEIKKFGKTTPSEKVKSPDKTVLKRCPDLNISVAQVEAFDTINPCK